MTYDIEFKYGDRVEILLHSRGKGYGTAYGWTSDWVKGWVRKVYPTTVVVQIDEYYYKWDHRVSYDRIRKI